MLLVACRCAASMYDENLAAGADAQDLSLVVVMVGNKVGKVLLQVLCAGVVVRVQDSKISSPTEPQAVGSGLWGPTFTGPSCCPSRG